ncbi:MAG TPA: DNA repair protein RecO [Gemmatimonadales bacterium]|nr:DNA repair protein RecO [Gemmatimonadales bacterium]
MSSLVTTSAVILRAYRYSETSKIVRLATRDLGVQSAIAKGALRPKSRFGAGLELLSEGVAQLYYRESRDLQTLAAFDVEHLRRGLTTDVARFAGGAALAEIMLRMAPPAPLPAAYDVFTRYLDSLATAPESDVDATAVRGLWVLMGVLGFEPSLGTCVRDDTPITVTGSEPVIFSSAEGGVICPACVHAQPPETSSRLPPQAYHDLTALVSPVAALPLFDHLHAAAHRRLVSRYAHYHLDASASADGKGSLPALEFWERRAWLPGAAS